jgi:TP901 family phage tail tape measure protein
MTSTSLTFDILAKDRASSTFRKIGDSASHSSSHVDKFAAVLKKSAIGIGLVTAAAGVFIAKAGVGYVNSLNQIQALTGANNKQMDAAAKLLEGNAGAYAQMGQTTGDAAAGVVELTKSGLSLHDALSAVYGTMTLAKAGALDVGDASSITANALNTFHLKAKQAGDVANYLANAANISSADVSDLAESFKYVSPVAASAGVSIKQTNAILAELANAGIKGSQAGTALRTFLLNLQAPASAAANLMDDLGIKIYDATGKMKPIGDVIQIVSDKLKGLNQADRNAALKTIFGKTGIAGATTILNEGVKGLAKYTKGIDRSGAAAKLAQSRSKGLAGSFDIVKSSAISGAQTIYRKFSPIADQVIRPLAKKFSDFAANIGPNLDKGFKKIGDIAHKIDLSGLGKKLGDQAKAWAGPVIAGFNTGLNDGDWSGLGKALGNGILKALQTLGDLTGKLGDVLSKIDWVGLGITVGKQAVPFAVGLAAGILDFDPVQLFKGIMAHWADILFAVLAIAFAPAKVVGKVGEILARIPLAGKFLEWGLNAFKKLGDGFKGWIWDALKFMGREFLSGFRRIFPNVGAKFAEHLALFPLRVQLMGLKLAEKGLKMVAGLGRAIVRGTGFVLRAIGELVARMLKPFVNANTWLVRRGVEVLGGLLRGIVSKMGDALRPLRELGGRILKAVGDMSRVLYNAGAAVIEGLWNGISSKLSWLGGKLGGVGSFIKDHKGPIEKDRELLRPAGRAIMDGLMAGIADRLMPLKTALGKVSALIQNMGTKISNLTSTRSGFLGTFQADSIFGTDMSAGGDISSLIAAQQGQASQASQLLSDVKAVTKMGLSKALVRQLRSQGTAGAAALHAIAMGSPAQIKQLNALDKQTSRSLRAAGLRAGDYTRGGSINDDIRMARKQEHVLELLEHHLKDLAASEKKGQTIVVKIGEEAIIRAIHRRNTRKGVKTANL